MGETSTSSASSSSGANCLGSCPQWQPGGARAQWLWSSEAGDTDVDADTDADFDDDDEDMFLADGDDKYDDDGDAGLRLIHADGDDAEMVQMNRTLI